jgi:hypothetical protein
MVVAIRIKGNRAGTWRQFCLSALVQGVALPMISPWCSATDQCHVQATVSMSRYYSMIYLIAHDTTTHRLQNKDTYGLLLVHGHVYQLTFTFILLLLLLLLFKLVLKQKKTNQVLFCAIRKLSVTLQKKMIIRDNHHERGRIARNDSVRMK